MEDNPQLHGFSANEVFDDATCHDGPGFAGHEGISREDLDGSWRRIPEQITLQHTDYTVGWICALPVELTASHAMLDRIHQTLPTANGDTNAYILGNIGTHNIAMACLPMGQYGPNNAATVASHMIRSFASIRFGLMVGVGGGVPVDIDIRLGDVVVGDKVVQHDLGKIIPVGFQVTGTARIPPPILLNSVSKLRALHETGGSQIPSILQQMQGRYPKLDKYSYPLANQDRLFRATYNHDQSEDCTRCNPSELQHREPRASPHPQIHYGGIASGSQVIKSGRTRDEIAKKLGVVCFEMEAAGLMDNFACIVIRGICDYADSHKNKQWQNYAAATAAAYAKELLLCAITPNVISSLETPTDILLRERRPELVKSLLFDRIDARHAAIQTEHPQTCNWLLRNDLYREWIAPSSAANRPGFLWISGKPGAGKSTVMKFAFKNATEVHRDDVAITSFFFNARGNGLEKSTFGLYRSLLHQLLSKFPDLEEVLDDTSLIPVVPIEKRSFPTIDVVRTLLWKAIKSLRHRQLICFVDALDECDEAQVREMVVFFEGLWDHATANHVRLKICFSSRHYPHIDVRHGLRLVLETQPGHRQDLEKYVQSHLRASGTGQHVDNVRSQILEKAGGVFMWVVLVVAIVNKEYVRGYGFRVKKRLNDIPTELSELFKDILRRDNDNMEDLLLCIQWVLFSERPLRPEEFYFAMLSGLPEDHDGEEVMTYDPELVTTEAMELFVTGCSKGLAEITKFAIKTVQFVHESVTDFLIKDNGLQYLWPDLASNIKIISHKKLRDCCHSQITKTVILHIQSFAEQPSPEMKHGRSGIRQIALDKFPFLEYATENVLYHANICAEWDSQDGFLDQFSFWEWVHLVNLLEWRASLHYTPTVTLTYILAERNLTKLLERHIQRYPNVHPKGERHGYPFFAAMANRHWAAARTLLGPAADGVPDDQLFPSTKPGSRDWTHAGLRTSPLHWAIENHRPVLARLLINAGHFDCTTLDSDGRSPLHSAAASGDEASLKLLLEKHIAISQERDGLLQRPLTSIGAASTTPANASHEMHCDCINLKEHLGHSPLSLAMRNRHEAIVRLLLKFGVELSHPLTDNWGGSSLVSFAFKSGELNWELAQILIEKGIVTHQALLSVAVVRGLNNVVELLVEKGASVNVMDENGVMPLTYAAIHGQDIVAQFLVRRAAAINFENQHGHTPLHQAVSSGYKTITELLVENGAHIDHRDQSGQTPLHRAAFFGRTTIVELLVEKGADIDSKDQQGKTPLHSAAVRSHADVVKLLVDKGASSHLADCDGIAPLEAVTSRGLLHVADILTQSLKT
ncbi:Ankyrin-3-like protein 3 [Colletotrichum chlorophyti]|uniref:Ankyrin-3-like protein 3 n=1 Tax=Colletotrichum chlorophyti TaxID=708187 RepID=A0A1Q8S419_9PEZI|nr:Ankyrin-3-like protein 3 [Colletotrichum chlorophyti]